MPPVRRRDQQFRSTNDIEHKSNKKKKLGPSSRDAADGNFSQAVASIGHPPSPVTSLTSSAQGPTGGPVQPPQIRSFTLVGSRYSLYQVTRWLSERLWAPTQWVLHFGADGGFQFPVIHHKLGQDPPSNGVVTFWHLQMSWGHQISFSYQGPTKDPLRTHRVPSSCQFWDALDNLWGLFAISKCTSAQSPTEDPPRTQNLDIQRFLNQIDPFSGYSQPIWARERIPKDPKSLPVTKRSVGGWLNGTNLHITPCISAFN